MIRAKFKVDEIRCVIGSKKAKTSDKFLLPEYEPCEVRTIILSPVYGNDDPNHENTKFWELTPSGKIELGTINPEAWKGFEIGKSYYVDFTEAE